MSLNEKDNHYWKPLPEVLEYVLGLIPDDWSVLEVGPGRTPLKRADHYADFISTWDVPKERLSVCNFDEAPLPFPDKSFDFIYCRHVLEDMWNPFRLCSEMSRVGKAGYVECPSPLIELTRGVDGTSLPYRGYHHHRFFVWSQDGTLHFVTKYPVVEHMAPLDETKGDKLVKKDGRYWNTYHLWDGELKYRHWQNAVDFWMVHQYPPLLAEAAFESIKSTDEFWKRMNHE